MILVEDKAKFDHAPDATLDYTWDFNDWLAASETVSAASFAVYGPDAQVTLSQQQHGTKTATVWATGGTAGAIYRLRATITTSAGRIDSRTILLNCVER